MCGVWGVYEHPRQLYVGNNQISAGGEVRRLTAPLDVVIYCISHDTMLQNWLHTPDEGMEEEEVNLPPRRRFIHQSTHPHLLSLHPPSRLTLPTLHTLPSFLPSFTHTTTPYPHPLHSSPTPPPQKNSGEEDMNALFPHNTLPQLY